MKIAFRVDASLQIGSGHVMRCLTLAEELTRLGAEVLFICRDLPGNMTSYIGERGFSVSVLSVPAQNSQAQLQQYLDWLQVPEIQDAEECGDVLSGQDAWDWLIVDHYALGADWEKRQRKHVKRIAVIDDLANRSHDCDMLIDQNFYIDGASRYSKLVADNCTRLLGPRYALLRREFAAAREKLKARSGSVNRILVFFGGVDLHNETAKTLAALDALGMEQLQIDIVIGAANPHQQEIASLCRENMHLHVQVSDMARLMAAADLCVGGGGTATWERCCLGLPALAWPIAENQQQLLYDSARNGLVYAVDMDNPEVEDIVTHLAALLDNPLLREHISTNGMGLIDGLGAQRVARLLARPEVDLRPAKAADVEDLYEWRNHESVRLFSRNQQPIEWEQHKSWFESVLKDTHRLLLIGHVEDRPVGVVRFDIDNKEAEISIYLVPDSHGRGYGRSIIESAENWLKDNRADVEYIVAEVLSYNHASVKLFDSCGYAVDSMKYRKRID